MKLFQKLIFGLFLLFYPLNFIGQQITFENYVEKFNQAQTAVTKGDYKEAATLHYALLDFLSRNKEQAKDSINIWYAKNYYSLSRMYVFEEDSLSLRYADSTIASALRTGDNKLIFRGYSLKYYCLYDVKGEEKTLNYLADQCIHYSQLTKDRKDLAESYMHKCNALVELKQPNEAFKYCEEAEKIFQETTDEQYLSSVYNNIANVFVKGGQIGKALEYYEKSHQLAIKLKDPTQFIISTRNLAEKNEMIGEHEKASNYYRDFGDSTQTYLEKKLKSGFTEAEAKFQTEQKDKEIAKQQLEIAHQKNTRNLWVFGSLAGILLTLFFFQWRSNKQKRKKIAVETQLQKEQEINDLRTKFLGNIAHEIRTPLTLVTGNLNLALENLENPKKVKKNIDTALENSKRITADANEILELLKFENSTAQVKKEIILLDETLKRIVFSFSSLVEMKQITLNYKSEIPKTLFAEIDIEKTEKIVNNLLSNAIKYSPSHTEINAESKIEDGKLIISVTDFGDGIHYDETEKIFERFYQSVRNTTVGGIGIGLSLSRELAEAMDGSLSVNSEWKKGSTFTFTVPITEVEAQTVASRKVINPKTASTFEAAEKIKTSKHSKILIVEDNPEMVNYLVEILSPIHQCEVAFDGEEALQKINSESFDLITSDIMMPKMDGFQLREALNQSETYKNIPFILLSAKTLEEDKIRGFRLGIDDYIVKPFNKNELIARIDNLLANKSARQTYQIKNPELLSTSESSDQKLLKKVEQFISENIDNEEFKIHELAESVGYSQRQFTRILKQYTGMTPVKFILEIRLQKAYQYLQHKTFFTLSEVRYHVGISSSAYFNKKFRERFGINPSDLLS